MNKREMVWLLIRIAGVCLLVNTCRYVFIVLENLMMVEQVDLREKLLSQSSGLIKAWIIEAIISLIVGLYLLGDGRLLFQLLNSESHRETEMN